MKTTIRVLNKRASQVKVEGHLTTARFNTEPSFLCSATTSEFAQNLRMLLSVIVARSGCSRYG